MGEPFACALSTAGKVKCWGQADGGVLGYDNLASRGLNPNSMGNNLPYISFLPVTKNPTRSPTILPPTGPTIPPTNYPTGAPATSSMISVHGYLFTTCYLFDNSKVKCCVSSYPTLIKPSSKPTL